MQSNSERPVVPCITSLNMSDKEEMRAWHATKKAAFIWDANRAGFSAEAAEFLYERYGDHAIGPFGF